MSFLSISNISKSYEGQPKAAVSNISFELQEGEILAIVGENGSGKTTLLKLVNGLTDADSGEVIFQDKPVTGPKFNLVPGHQQIKMLFQEFNLFPKHSIKENILYNIRAFSKEEQSSILQELLSLCKLQGLEEKLPSELSGGQQQRVALAKAIADKPLLLLMDEPFSNLDLFLKDEIKRKVIHKIKEEGNSAIFITHDLKDALALADRIAVMREGKLLQIDIPENIYEKPANEYVAYLFGKVNIIEANSFIKAFHLADHKKFNKVSTNKKACIRPEHLQITKEEKSMAKGLVKHIAYLGDSYELDVQVKDFELRINTRKKDISKGDKIYLKFSPSKVHIL